jgi:hypothetical protein
MTQQFASSMGVTLQANNDALGIVIAAAVADAFDTAMSNAAITIVDAIQDSTVAIVTSTDNNTQVIAGTVVDTSATQVSAARLTTRATASYKFSDLNMVDQ